MNMKPFIRKKLPYILIAVQAVLILGLLFYIVPGRYRLYDIVLYDASEYVPANPMIGYAPAAENPEDCAQTSLVFIQLPFSEWEPERGVFDTEGLSRKYHVDDYRAAGKHAVLRFVCDVPGTEAHADIPQWLVESSGSGVAYEDSTGRGFAPDYADETFLDAHREALRALADWCRQDSFVSYVEVGSLGQNGVLRDAADSAPAVSDETVREYARQYEQAFPAESGIRLLFSPGVLSDAPGGSWNDVLGDADASGVWQRETVSAEAVNAEQTGPDAEAGNRQAEAGKNVPLWTIRPVGGGLSSGVPMEELLMDRLSDTLEQVRSSHVSFIGPLAPDSAQQSSNGSEMIRRDIGYCIYLSRMQTTVDFIEDDLLLHFTFANIGQAPLYWDWPVTMYIYDNKGTCIREQTLDLQISGLLPDGELTAVGSVPYDKSLLKGYSVGLSVLSPDGRDMVTFAQKGVLPDAQGVHIIYRYRGGGHRHHHH